MRLQLYSIGSITKKTFVWTRPPIVVCGCESKIIQKSPYEVVDPKWAASLFTAKVLGDLIPGGGPLLWLLWCEICGNPPTAWDTWQSQMSWEYSEKSLKSYFWSTCLWWSSWPALQVNNHLFKVLSSLPRGLTRGIFLDIWVRINTKIYSCSLLMLVWLLRARY